MSHTLINSTFKNRLGCSLLPFTLIPQYLKRFIKNRLKQTKFEYKTVKSTQLSLVLVGLRDFQINPDRRRCVKRGSGKQGNICSVSVFFVWVGSQNSPRRAKKDSNIPSPGRTRSVKCPTPGPTKTIKSPPHALPPPRRHNIDRCITTAEPVEDTNFKTYRNRKQRMKSPWHPV